jgi:hypothetical protein
MVDLDLPSSPNTVDDYEGKWQTRKQVLGGMAKTEIVGKDRQIPQVRISISYVQSRAF